MTNAYPEAHPVLDRLPELDSHMGPSFTFGRLAMKALRKAAPNEAAWKRVEKAIDGKMEWDEAKPAWNAIKKAAAGKVDWDKIERNTVIESIERHGQDPDDVIEAVSKYSPNCQSAEKRKILSDVVEGLAPELTRRYDELKNKMDAEYEAQKKANGGVIKFVERK